MADRPVALAPVIDTPFLNRQRLATTTEADWTAFLNRFADQSGRLRSLFEHLYGATDECEHEFAQLVVDMASSWQARPAELKTLDRQRDATPDWFRSNRMLGGVCYVDLYAGSVDGLRSHIPYFVELGLTYLHVMPIFLAPKGNSDGGYAISSYRDIDPKVGDIADLHRLAEALREAGISLVLDFVFNHTSNEHLWAQRARAGDAEFEKYYWIFRGRDMPDAFEATTREIFPENHAGSFVPLDDDRWVWATFHDFQWDLNYSNPAVFRAMAGEMLFLANQGVEILRMDAVAFIWKQLGTSNENLPEAHLLLQAFNAVCRIAAPSLLFKSEAIVHPDDVLKYVRPDECQLSYNPLQMALIWSTLASRDTRLLSDALEHRHALPPGTSWVNYVRSHDDIGWTFDDGDARRLGTDPEAHRRFLNDFFINRFPGSFARGEPFQENPHTGDARVSGTTASLAGLEAGDPLAVRRILLAHSIILSTGGIPLLYLGDEVGQLNDRSYELEPDRAGDSRWIGRPRYPAREYEARADATTPAGMIHRGLRRLIRVRKRTPEFAGNELVIFGTHNDHVLGYQRPGADGSTILVLANFGDQTQALHPDRFSALGPARNIVTGREVDLTKGLVIRSLDFVWLRV
jgi:amylosucrase